MMKLTRALVSGAASTLLAVGALLGSGTVANAHTGSADMAPAANAAPTATSAAHAAPDAAQILDASDLSADTIEQAKADLPAVDRLEATAVSVAADGTVTFDATKAKASNVDQRIINEYAYGVRQGGGSVVGMSTAGLQAKVAGAPQVQMLAKSKSCHGTNKSGTAVWGPYYQLDSCNTTRLISALGSGAGVATVAGLLASETGVGGIAGGVAAAVMGIGAGAISFCAADGNGVVLRILWIGTPYCTGP